MRLTITVIAATLLPSSAIAAPLNISLDNQLGSRDVIEARGFGSNVISWLCDLPRVDAVCEKTSKIIDKWIDNIQNTVYTPQGKISGLKIGNTFRYTVPYAKPPTGSLRFQPPSAISNWSGTYNASSLPAACPQSNLLSSAHTDNENCLFMNIWVPTAATSLSKLPVFIWLHGGSFVAGSISDATIDGSELAAKGNMVVVTVQYRLGALGFLRAPEFGILGNMGLLDAVEALHYIKRNIASFGGNPASVTLAGQSSGASLIKSLLSAPRADALFQRAILQSAPLNYGDHTVAISNAVGQSITSGLGCSNLECLQRKSVTEVLGVQDSTFLSAPATIPGVAASEPIRPVVDGTIVKQPFFNFVNNANLGNRNRQIIFTTVKDEAGPTIASVSQDQPLPLQYYPAVIPSLMDQDRAMKVLTSGLYNPDSAQPDAARDTLEVLGTDWIWRCATQQAALNMTVNDAPGKVWLAQFDAGIPHPSNQGINFCQGRVCHQDDIQAVFNTGEGLNAAQTGLEKEMLARWSAFAKTGNPNAAGFPQWSAVQSGANLNMLILQGSSSIIVPSQRQEQCGLNGFWGNRALFDEQLVTAASFS